MRKPVRAYVRKVLFHIVYQSWGSKVLHDAAKSAHVLSSA